uniref:uncharacterized protein KIAA1755 homolog isoform X2 n=1 Tax=Jaculus jaculus TaxID=51337 RepID=UPI001E1B314A|nr:uncharacterized protein KIAA1755 homolog isoform X2 [Jaculus jaculus]
MDPSALDTAIQHALAGLYPPFEATAPTVLGQVFRLLDSDFRGDGLSFLLDFLVPAQRLCEQVREAACAPYAHCLFQHEGWPLCLREEVVVHLAPLNPLLLRPGDFYLQVEPLEEQSVHMTLKCLSLDLRTVDRKPVPGSSYPMLFTPEWLEAINKEFEGSPLHNCLVASENGIAPVPWTRITSPEFVDDRSPAANVVSPAGDSCPSDALHPGSPQELCRASSPGSQGSLAHSGVKGKDRTSGDKYPGLIKVEPSQPGKVDFRMDHGASRGLGGEYVTLLGSSQEHQEGCLCKDVVAPGGCTLRTLEERSGIKGMPLPGGIMPLPEPTGELHLGRWASAKPAGSGEGACVWGSRRKARLKVSAHNTKRQSQQPHLGVPEQPLECISGVEADVSEEPASSKMQGSLRLTEAIVQLRPGPTQASSPHLSPAASAASASEAKTEKTKQGHASVPKPVACASQNTSSSPTPTSGLQLSGLTGQRPALVPPKDQHGRPCKAPCSLDSLQPHGTKAPGKDGTSRPRTSGPTAHSAPLSGEQAAFPEVSVGPPGRGPSLEECPRPAPRIVDLGVELLHSGIACLPGGRDRAGRPLLLVSVPEGAWEAPWCTASRVTELLSYLCGVPRSEDKAKGLAVVIDGRKGTPQPALLSALHTTQALTRESVGALLFLGENAAALRLQELPVQVEILTSLKSLSRHVDSSQLPEALEGPFPYCHSEWVRFFQVSSLLQAAIQAFEKGDLPSGAQEATRCLNKSKELMEAVLKDPGLLGLQREGGATLARLQHEASRLDPNPDVRSHLAEAAALYSLVDEQLHVLVTTSNHLLGRLELRVRLGHLEAAIHQVSDWMEREGSQRLQALVPTDASMESVERAHVECEDFFLQAAAQYRRGLELCKQAAQLGAAAGGAGEAGETELPELVAFASTQRAFQAKLTHFYMAAERQRTDLETLLHLHRFSKKITWFHMDCQDLMTQLRLGKAPKASPGDERRLHRYLQRLTSEFSAEKLEAMGLQAASLSQASLGQELWDETQRQHEEIHGLLRMALAHCRNPADLLALSAHAGRSRPVAKGKCLHREATPRGRRDLPLQDSQGMEPVTKSYWPSQAPRGGQSRNVQAGPLPHETGQAVDTDGGRGAPDLPEPAPERLLASLFSWQHLPRQSQGPHPAGGSFSSEGTDSQTSLEDSPQTSPPASL